MNYLMIFLAFMLYLRYFQICGRQRKPIQAMVINSLSGVVLLIPLSFFTSLSGAGIGINYATVAVSSVLGLPGVIMVFLLSFIV